MFRNALYLSFAALAGLAACAGGEAQRVAVPQLAPAQTQPIGYRSVALREVSLPSYAAAEEIFVADETGLIAASDKLIWADDPVRAVTLELTRHLAQVTGARVASEPWPFTGYPDVQIELRVEEMLAHADGSFRLSGQYFVAADNGRNIARLFTLSAPIAGEGSAADIAAARGEVVRALAQHMVRNGLR